MKNRRQSAILEVVEQEPVRSQEQLRQRLASRGFDVTQATLSRDVKERGLLKRSSDGGPWGGTVLLVMSRLAAPWQLIRLGVKAAGSDTAARVAETPYGVAVTIVLAELERQVG